MSVAALALPFFGLVLIGYVAGRLARLPEAAMGWLNLFVVNVALPALFFVLVSATPLAELARWRFVLATTACTGAAFALAYLVGRLLTGADPRRGPDPRRGRDPRRGPDLRRAALQGVLGSYSNIGYMGPGLTLAAIGPAAVAPTALIFAFDSLLLFTLLPVAVAFGGGREDLPAALREVARRVLTHPFNLALAAGVLASATGFVPPAPVASVLASLKGAAAPCALFALGVTVSLRPLGRVPREVPALLAIKLVLHPLLVLLVVGTLGGAPPSWTATAVLMAALPPALNVYVLARQYGAYVEEAGTAVLLGTLAAVVTVTLVLGAIGAGLLPAAP